MRGRHHRLTAKARRKLPKRSFGLPGARGKGSRKGRRVGKYPMPNRSHAISAEGRARQQLNKGNLSEGQYREIMSKAHRVLGEGRKARRRRS